MILQSPGALRATVRQFCTGLLCRQKATANVLVDNLSVPLKATWSVGQLLSTYPAPELSDGTFSRLHRLAALDPPDSTSPDKKELKLELQELLRLVEAVKLVDTSSLHVTKQTGLLDSRIWAEGRGMDLEAPTADHLSESHGDALLKHAKRHIDGQYVVETAARATRGAKSR
ncbi:unnamed protein product [Rhizoctonia solani]|uniref:Uncharacterized protein n=1 Tax=Rhizoctonia solani TaxID=456999 RepID=A0A8H3ALS9_9AGAM|nr:unnamed protein product [Rhizoctonia solani]CAE6528212.1 unnamed protein product [Rhizoctonia solani]